MILETTGLILLLLLINIFSFVFSNGKKINTLSCGLIGFSGTKGYNLDKIKTLLLWNSLERGEDSTGIYTPKSDILKDNIKAISFINNNKDFKKLEPDNVLLAHVRKKSIGFNSWANSHPYRYGNIVLAHNGTLTNYNELADFYGKIRAKYNTDSQVLADLLNENYQNMVPDNPEDKFKVLGQYEGAAALLFYNDDTETLYACRDSQRPLYYGYIDDTEMYISSIEESLKLIGCSNVKQFVFKTVYEIVNGEIINKTDYPENVKLPVRKNTINMATFADIVYTWDKYKQDNIIHFKKSNAPFTGIYSSSVDGRHLIGYNLEYTGVTLKYKVDTVWASATKGKYYTVIGYDDTKLKNRIIVIDDNEEEKIISTSDLNTSNFIPVKDGYVTLLKGVIKKGTEEILAREGDVLRVVSHTWLEDTLEVINEFNNRKFRLALKFARVSTEQEINTYEQDIALLEYNKEKDPFVSNAPMSNFNLPTLFDKNNLKPIHNYIDKDKEEYNSEGPDIEKTITDDMSDIRYDVLVTYLLHLQDLVNDLSDKYDAKKNISIEIDSLSTAIGSGYDTEYLNNLCEEPPKKCITC